MNSEFLPSATPEQFIPPVSRWKTVGGLVLLGFVGCAIAMAAIIKYKVTVKASAIIRPAGELRIVEAARSGTVKSIEVKANQEITEGDIIFTIDNSRLQTDLNQLQGRIQQAMRQWSQINAQISGKNSQIAAETDQTKRTIAVSEQQLRGIQRNYQDRQITSETEVKEAEAALELATEELRRYRQLANTGAIAQLQLKEREAALKTALARLERAKTGLDPSNAEVATARERIAEEKARGKANLARLNQELQELIQGRVEIENQLSSDKQELQQLETELQETVIRASVSGTIAQLNLRNRGQVVSAGDEIAQIAPSNTPLEIKALVSPQNISKVEIGQKVQMRVSACSYTDYGTLSGSVTAISPDAINNEGNSSFDVTIKPETPILSSGIQECVIQAGMNGRADIISREETILTFILRKARLITNL